MENFVLQLVQHPVISAGYVLSIVGAAGALLFFAGFFGSIKHLFTYSESADHMDHARTRALWGLYLSMAALGIWELIRMLMGEVDPSSTLILAVILLSPIWIPLLKGLFTKSDGH